MRRYATMIAAAAGLALLTVWVLGRGGVSDRRLDAAIEQWKDAGHPTSLADLAPPAPAADQNAATVYTQAADLLPAMSDAQRQTLADPWNATVRDLQLLVDPCRDALVLAKDAGEKTHCAWPAPFHDRHTGKPAAFTGGIATLGRLLVAQARLQALGDDHDAAARTTEALLDLGRHITADPGAIALLLRLNHDENALLILHRLLVGKPLSPNRLVEKLGQTDYRSLMIRCAEAEGAALLQMLEAESLAEAKGLLGQQPDQPLAHKNAERLQDDVAATIEQLALRLEQWRQPWPKQQKLTYRLPDWSIIAAMTVRGLTDINEEVTAIDVQRTLALTALQLVEYRMVHRTLPIAVADLDVNRTDPATGQSFRYQPQGEGFLLASEASLSSSASSSLFTWAVQ